jgi:hypothetical protein
MAYTGGFGVDTTGIDFGDTFLPSAGSSTYGYDFNPRSQFPEDFYNTQSNSGGGFFDQFGRFIGGVNKAIPGISRTVGAVRDIINPQDSPGVFNPNVQRESTEKIKKEADETYAKIQDVFTRIAGTTGVSTEDAVQQYYKQFSDTMSGLTAQGRADLKEDPDISKQYAQLNVRIPEIQRQYSTLNNPRFAAAYKAPDAVASIDTNAIKNVMTLGPAYKEQYSYEDPESQKNIYGRRNAIGDIASFYANDPSLSNFMVSATDPNIQNLMNYS